MRPLDKVNEELEMILGDRVTEFLGEMFSEPSFSAKSISKKMGIDVIVIQMAIDLLDEERCVDRL